MAVKVSIGSPILTINQGSTVMVTDLGGEIALESEQVSSPPIHGL
jgi:hypothetical protein